MRKLAILGCWIFSFCAFGSPTEGKLTGELSFLSNYVDRGFSNTNNRPVLQGEMSFTLPSGFYTSIWGSNIWLERQTSATLELYIPVGYNGQYQNLTWNLLVAADFAPGARTELKLYYIEFEAVAGYTWKNNTFNLGFAYSPAYGAAGELYYPFLDALVDLPAEVKARGRLGWFAIERNAVFGTPNYYHWEFELSRKFKMVDVTLMYHDSSLTANECFNQPESFSGAQNICGAGIVAGIRRDF